MKINISKILKGLGEATDSINPVVGSGLMLAGVVADEFDGIPDDVLENKFVGFSKSSEIIKSIAEKDEITKEDRLRLLAIADNLDGINKLFSKIQKLFK